MSETLHRPVAYDPNEPETQKAEASWGAKLPTVATATNIDGYVSSVMPEIESPTSAGGMMKAIAKAISDLQKAPEMSPFSRLATLPDPSHKGGVLEWPGIPPSAIQSLVRDNVAPKAIIGMRCDDVQRYAVLSKHPWKPGWRITLREGLESPDEDTLKQVKEVESFLQNCNDETKDNARIRDKFGYTSFQTFLNALTRDTLTYDGMAIWTQPDAKGHPKAFKAISAASIRLTHEGYGDNPDIFAVAVDEASQIRATYTREQLIWVVRNSRTDADVQGYGWSEVDMAMALIRGFTNALELNLDTFNKNSVPNGILLASGNWMQKQLDILSRLWTNLKRGTSKTFAMPAISVPKDGDLKLLDLTRLKGNDVYYRDLMNMIVGLMCALYRFPVSRLGYKISGTGSDTQVNPSVSSGTIVDDDDPGLAPLLNHLESLINQYLVWPRWPALMFRFNGKNPKEDAREYEARMNAMTYGERRAMSDLKPLAEIASTEFKKIAELMDLCPSDSGLVSVFQALVTTLMSPCEGDAATPGAPFPAKRDAAASEAHGHTSGVRRDSAAESSPS